MFIIPSKIVIKRNPHSNIVALDILIEIDDEKVIDLEDEFWNKNFIDFSKKVESLVGNSLCDLLECIRKTDVINKNKLYEVGRLMGTIVNMYVKMLKDKKNKQVDLFSSYFYHHTLNLKNFTRGDLNIKQFCIKNSEIINNSTDSMDIDYNI